MIDVLIYFLPLLMVAVGSYHIGYGRGARRKLDGLEEKIRALEVNAGLRKAE